MTGTTKNILSKNIQKKVLPFILTISSRLKCPINALSITLGTYLIPPPHVFLLVLVEFSNFSVVNNSIQCRSTFITKTSLEKLVFIYFLDVSI